MGFVSERENKNRWDRRKEYKLNIRCIQNELYKLGYNLDGYSAVLPLNEKYNAENETKNGLNEKYNPKAQKVKTVTEITTEITTKDNSLSADKSVDDDKLKFDEDSTEIKIVDFFIKKLQSINPKIKVPATLKQKQKWAVDIDRLMRIDKKDKEEICRVIVFAVQDDFWCSNILSASSLRKHYDKLVIKLHRYKQNKVNNTTSDNVTETEKMLAKRRREREVLNDV